MNVYRNKKSGQLVRTTGLVSGESWELLLPDQEPEQEPDQEPEQEPEQEPVRKKKPRGGK